MFISVSFSDELNVEIIKKGTEYTLSSGNVHVENDSRMIVGKGTTVHINGGELKYEFDVSEYQPWVDYMTVGIQHSHADKNEWVKGDLWAYFDVKKKGEETYEYKRELTYTDDSIAGNTTTAYTLYNITSPGNFMDTKDDGGYKVTVRITAPYGITDHAEAWIYTVSVTLHLHYNKNTLIIDGAPKAVDFGEIDLGTTGISKTVDIKNVGTGSSSLSWKIDSTKTATPTWIKGTSPDSVTSGGTRTITLIIDASKVEPGNVKQLKGKLAPIYSVDSNLPTSKGFKCDIYHFPGNDLSNLDDALSSTNKRLVYSEIIPSIEFNKGGSMNPYGENELFKSGTKTTNVRRDFLAIFSGFITIDTSGTHTFYVTSDDGFRLKIYKGSKWETVKEYTGGRGTAESSGSINLDPGIYPIELAYFQGGGGKSLTLEWIKPGGSREVVPSQAMDNGMNILVSAAPKKPTVTSLTSTNVISGKAHVRTSQSAKFTAQATDGSTSVGVMKYLWKKVGASESPGDSSTFEATTYNTSTHSADKNFQSTAFPDPSDYKVYCIVADAKGVESDSKSIEVRAWNPPIVKETPPQSAITAKTVSWYNGKYAGIVNQSVNFMADGAKDSANNNTNENIDRFIWDFDGNWDTTVDQKTQKPIDQSVSYTWTSRPSGNIKCKAITNFNIESDERSFTPTIYDPPIVEAGGPYTSKPKVEKELKGSVVNAVGYSNATFVYQWYVKEGDNFNSVITGSDGTATYTWMSEGTYETRFDVTVTTSEGLTLTASDTATIAIEAGKPTAKFSAKTYRGGINGGNFSPVQFEGNSPDFVEADDIGTIDKWLWSFEGAGNKRWVLDFNGTSSGVTITGYKGVTGTSPRTVSAWIKVPQNGNYPIISWGENVSTKKFTFRVQTDNGQAGALRVEVNGGYKVGTTVVADGQWHHVAAILPSKTTPNVTDIQLFVDGKPEGESASLASNINTSSKDDVTIGKDVTNRFFLGDISEVAIWNRAFSEDEIWALLDKSPLDNASGLVGYWPFDDGNGNVVKDKSASAKNGAVVGAKWVEVMSSIKREDYWTATQAYTKAGKYPVGLAVRSQYGKWSYWQTADVIIVDGKITGYVKAADLRTPVKDVYVKITSSHVDQDVLASIATADSRPSSNPYRLTTFVDTDGKLGIQTQTDEKGFYSFEHIPLGSYLVKVIKTESKIGGGSIIHEFESNPKATELTLDAPGQLAIDFTDLSVFPISGRIVYSIKKYGTTDVPVEDAVVEAQPVGSTSSSIKSLLSKKSFDATGGNYNLPLFSGQYSFIVSRQGHDIRIKPGIADDQGIITISKEKTDLDFIDYTERNLTVFVVDSGNYKMIGINIEVSGENGQATSKSDDQDGKLETKLPPGKYTVTVKEAVPSTQDVDLTNGDQSVTMTIPVKIELSITPIPKFFDAKPEFLELFNLKPEDNPEGYMYYYPPEPRTHTYTITATANGHAVEDFNLFVNDDISMMTPEPPSEQELGVTGSDAKYTITAGLPKLNRTVDPPIADQKYITFRAEKDKYAPSDTKWEWVTVLGDVAVGSAQRIVSIPVVNYTVLHDPPGDGSYSYLDDSMTLKGIVSGMTTTINQSEVPVYPSPWRDEKSIKGVTFEKEPGVDTTFQDLGSKGLLGSNRDVVSTGAAFTIAGLAEAASGFLIFLSGPAAFAAQLIKVPIIATAFEAGAAIPGVTGIVQYEVNPTTHLETPSGDSLTDLVGPGKGDIYFGEGWTLGLQTKYRLGIKLDNGKWQLVTDQIETYDILDRTNQYIYTIRDIQNIIKDMDAAIIKATDEDEKTNLQNGKKVWEDLLNKNLAYVWNRDYASQGKSFEDFIQSNSLPDSSENLIFSAGPKFEYSRKISESIATKLGYTMTVGTNGGMEWGLTNKWGFEFWGTGLTMEMDFTGSASIETGAEYGAEWESGKGTEQTVGFVLNDNDIGDNISTRVYADPVWGTPLFFQDPGSVTSDPWETGTNKAVDVSMSLLSVQTGPFDYHDGAHYKIKLQYEGVRVLESTMIGFEIYAPATANQDDVTVKFNGAPQGGFELSKDSPSAIITVSIYPPEIDQDNSEDKQYSVDIGVFESGDAQIYHAITLKPKFSDLRPPRATVVTPYDGQRISPALFKTDSPFKIQVTSSDTDLASIQLQIRTKQPNGVWEPWRNLSGMKWEDGKTDPAIEIFEKLDRDPPYREFTFSKWTESEIKLLGVGEYAIRAVATDKATNPNTDLDPPSLIFLVDDSKPTVLTSIPDYQAKESERIYRGELSVTFTDDMSSVDFSDRTFVVTDLLKGGEKVGGFVSYSPALRKGIFVPIVPFNPNGFYRVEVKTDTEKDGTIKPGVHDLAGNPLDNAFMWTFHTTDAPFEPMWSITLSATDGTHIDANNIAAVEYGAMDGDDEKDARSVPSLASALRMSFLSSDKVEYDRDIHPADGRLSHHWFFAISNAASNSDVTIRWKPSIKLTKTERQYQVIRLIEFDDKGVVTKTITLDPTLAPIDPNTGDIGELIAYTYKPTAGEVSRYFRLDVQKADLVATGLKKGSSGWKFLSIPITPQVADPFVNLGDDIDPFQLYRYDTKLNGYKIYPLDLGEVSLQAGYGYFTRLNSDVEVDVGGVSNLTSVTLNLKFKGWNAIGNPFVLPVKVADLKFNNKSFAEAITNGLLEGTLYRWKIDSSSDTYDPLTDASQMDPWEGYWIKTLQDDVTLTISAPANIAGAPIQLPDSYQPPLAPPVRPLITAPQFDLRLELVSKFASDVTTTLGTRDNAQLSWDTLDQSEPPTLSQTVAVFFDHTDWGDSSGLYNMDYQPTLKVGEERTWTFTVFTDKANAEMTLSWEKSIAQIPGDIMLYFHRCDSQSDWQDMREVRSVNLNSRSLITKIPFEVRAQRFEMAPPSDVNVSTGEKQVTIRWRTNVNEFIDSYVITRQECSAEGWKDGEGVSYTIKQIPEIPISQYVDVSVDEDKTYTYQVSTRFRTGAKLQSELFTVRIKPVIKQTVLMQSYPNPFNPEVWIPYELVEQTIVTVQIFNASGQLVRTLDLGVQQSGRYTNKEKAAYWDGRTEVGERVASGIYFYVFKAGGFTASKKMILLK
jgi:hypothetical protein